LSASRFEWAITCSYTNSFILGTPFGLRFYLKFYFFTTFLYAVLFCSGSAATVLCGLTIVYSIIRCVSFASIVAIDSNWFTRLSTRNYLWSCSLIETSCYFRPLSCWRSFVSVSRPLVSIAVSLHSCSLNFSNILVMS
jgi:hypothetical protein